MIAAVSRFRVANGMEDQVAQAFRERPRLVEDAPGFLGLEVFAHGGDAALFYLVTRWTDAASFRRWHGSEQHHLSHRGIPRGLKLDPAFTRIVLMDRLDAGGPPLEPLARDTAPLLSLYLDASRQACLLVADPDGTVRSCNRAVRDRLRREADEIAGRPVWDFLTQADARMLRERLGGPRRPGERFLLNFVDDRESPFTLQCHMDAQPDYFILIGEAAAGDEQRLHEEMLQLSNQLAVLGRENARRGKAADAARREAEAARRQTDAMLESISDGFLALAGTWKAAYVNREALRILKLSAREPDELLGRELWSALPSLAGTEFELQCRAAVEDGESRAFEYHLPDQDAWVNVRTYPSRSGLSIYLYDTTDRKRLEERLTRQTEELLRVDEQKDRFLATLGHELRSPLGAMANAVYLLRHGGDSGTAREKACGVLERQLRFMERLVEDLQDVSRIKQGRLRLRVESADLRAILEQAVETARPLIERRNHALAVDLPAGPLPVACDRQRIAQVATNLLTNAARYTDPEGRITLTAGREAGGAWFSVRDTGIGFPPAAAEALFDLFAQSGARSRAAGGMGIGLALARGLAELHGGTLQARSEGPGRGAWFTVRLPARGPGPE